MRGLIGATPRGQPWTSAVTLPQGRNGLSTRRMAVLWTFREPSLCRHVHRALMRNAVLNLTLIIPATACHQRNYVERYSRFMLRVLIGRRATYVFARGASHNQDTHRCRLMPWLSRYGADGSFGALAWPVSSSLECSTSVATMWLQGSQLAGPLRLHTHDGWVFRLVSCDLMVHTHLRAAAACVVSCAVSLQDLSRSQRSGASHALRHLRVFSQQ